MRILTAVLKLDSGIFHAVVVVWCESGPVRKFKSEKKFGK